MDVSGLAINTTGLTKRFGAKTVLHDLELEVRRGETYGFLGPNGAGKTTTISCLMDFIRPTAGTIEILGRTYAAAGAELRRQIGYVPADPQLYPGLTGHQHLELCASLFGLGTEQSSQATQLAGRLDLDLHAKARVLSTGNQQKLALVLALAAQPQLLILDEPTRGLDPLVQDQVYAELKAFREGGGTIFISSHNLAEVQKICDRVGIIKAGRLIASKSLRDLLGLAVHEVRATFTKPYKLSLFRTPGVEIVSHTDHTLYLRVTGDLNAVVAELAHTSLSDLEVGHASLEDIFTRYYREDQS